MKYCAIIAEFNPLTNGHSYLLSEAKRQTGLPATCIMSGNFVQRGELACMEKYQRAILAIHAGADFVLELPTLFAISGAPYFAEGAVKCLHNLGCVSHLAFGIELDNTDELVRLARFKVKESQTIKDMIGKFIKNGDNYSVANFKAYTNNSISIGFDEAFINQVFNSPNNILALEYLTSIYKLEAPITPVFIKRLDNGYNSENPKVMKINGRKTEFAGASYIRNALLKGDYKKIKKLVPLYTFDFLKSKTKQNLEIRDERLDALVLDSIRTKSPKQLETYYDYNESLASLIYSNALNVSSIEELVALSSGKSYRKSRIRKLCLYPLLGLTKERAEAIANPNAISVLAVKSSAKAVMSDIIKSSKVKLIISNKDHKLLQKKSAIDLNQRGSDIYNICSRQQKTQDLTVFVD